MTAVASKRQYYPALDGLRGLAILLVVIYHNFGFINYFFFGWLGVDLFFVLSGFLITGILLDTVSERNYLRNFFVRRILRIFPLYYASLVIFILLLPLITDMGSDFAYYSNNQVWFWVYLQNWLFVLKPPQNNFLTHFWSLAVEEQFYLVWPFVILLVRNLKILFLILAVVLLGVLYFRFFIWTQKIQNLSYFSLYTFTRIDGICIGCIIAVVQRINRNLLIKYTPVIVLTLAGGNFAFYFFNRNYQFDFPYLALAGYTTFAAILGLLVHEATLGKTRILNWTLSIPLLKFFGNISYGLYIIHWPLYLLLIPGLNQLISSYIHLQPKLLQLCSSVIVTGIAILTSVLSYKYFERYFMKLKSNFT